MTTTLRSLTLAIVAVVVASGVYTYAGAQNGNTNQPPAPFMGRRGPGGPGRGGPMGMLPMLGRQLQLTDSQRDQIKAIADSHRDEWKALMDRERTARAALEDAVAADNLDESAIRQKSADLAAVNADVAVARAHAHAEVFQLLTADQKAKLKEMRANFNARRPQPHARH